MELTVLGNAGRYLARHAGGSGYLVEAEGMTVLLDAGAGVAGALESLGVEELDAVVLSHFHWDHVSDIVPVRRAMREGAPLVVPQGERRRLDALAEGFAFEGSFETGGPIVEARGEVRAGPLTMRFAPTKHSAPAFATRIGGLVYASDSADCGPLRELARGAEMLVMHTLLPVVDPESEHARIHATAASAGALAAEVGARRLLLSHRYHESPDVAMREAGGSRFPGVELAVTRATYEV